MKLGSAFKVGLVILIVSIFGYGMFKSVNESASGSGGYRLWARFRDASGLVDKSRVVIAGLTMGEITDRTLEGRFARVTVRVRKNSEIWSNASIFKKSSSLLGEFYLEIDPGAAESVDDKGRTVKNTLLKEGDEIKIVVEAVGTGDLIASASKLMPHIDEVLVSVRDLANDTRALVNGSIANMAKNLDQAVAEDTKLVKSFLERADRISADVAEATKGAGPKVDRILKNVEDGSRDLKDLIATTKGEITMTGDEIRQKLDKIDKSLDEAEALLGHGASVAKKIDEDQGTLGKLVNDPAIADNVEQITEDVKGFTQGLFSIQTIVGMKADYAFVSGNSREYLSLEFWTRPDRYYLIELGADPRGVYHTYYEVDNQHDLRRVQTIDSPGLKLTLQYAKRLDWLTLRIGVKDTTGGFGGDADLWGGKLRLSLDAWAFTFSDMPRVKVALAWNFFRGLYLIGGLDDALNAPVWRPVTGNDVSGELTTQYYFGREPFLGLMLRFNDEDLKQILYIGGSAVAGMAKN